MPLRPASGCRSLASLRRGIVQCRKCRLGKSRTHAVPGEGPREARIVFVGEAPGEEEDRTGRPFRGLSGRTFDRLLHQAGIRRESVFVTSAVKCRPPENRSPRPDELATCRAAWMEPQLWRIRPRLLVTLGAIPLRQLLGETRPLRDIHGRLRAIAGIPLLPTYHPAAAMRFPKLAERAGADFRAIQTHMRA